MLTINTLKMRKSKNQNRKTRDVQILEINNFMAATKIKLRENLLKIIFQTYFWCTKMCYKDFNGTSAKKIKLGDPQ